MEGSAVNSTDTYQWLQKLLTSGLLFTTASSIFLSLANNAKSRCSQDSVTDERCKFRCVAGMEVAPSISATNFDCRLPQSNSVRIKKIDGTLILRAEMTKNE